jgi:hypothetical protein
MPVNHNVSLFDLTPSTTAEFDTALKLMEENMEAILAAQGIAWDREWHRKNYKHRENYSIQRSGTWIGFVSLGIEERRLFVHTLQLIPPRRAAGTRTRFIAFTPGLHAA